MTTARRLSLSAPHCRFGTPRLRPARAARQRAPSKSPASRPIGPQAARRRHSLWPPNTAPISAEIRLFARVRWSFPTQRRATRQSPRCWRAKSRRSGVRRQAALRQQPSTAAIGQRQSRPAQCGHRRHRQRREEWKAGDNPGGNDRQPGEVGQARQGLARPPQNCRGHKASSDSSAQHNEANIEMFDGHTRCRQRQTERATPNSPHKRPCLSRHGIGIVSPVSAC